MSAPEVERWNGHSKLPEGHGQAAEGDVALGPRIAQPLGLGSQMGGHLGQQLRLVEVEGLAQFQLERAAAASAPGRPSSKTAVGLP